ncbi:hypothetical protein GE061_010777 [Apolygus lucorum]|uniref:Chitin-binding type-2 domain-containing protein n=1 Tax=Apolygus lucorum TaxID=248454 RepID=A0A8S9XVW8_APOLU|nr:hypothetical protein GE061_010777 [Apolygus lucorum]
MYGGFEFLTLNNNFSLDKSWIFGLKVSEKPFQYRLIGLMGNVIPTCINATLVNKSREDLLEIFLDSPPDKTDEKCYTYMYESYTTEYKIFTLCFGLFVFYQVQGAPQYVNLAWYHPMSLMNMQIRPHPAITLQNVPQESMYSEHNPGSPMSQTQLNEVETSLDDVDEDEPNFTEYGRRQGYLQCDPRKLFQRSACLNSTWVRTCTLGGIYRDLACPQNFNCISTIGICVPQLTRRLQTFTCPSVPGTYPEPRNCMVYHECPQGNTTTPITTTCFWPQIYDPLSQSCQMETPERPCYKINCIGQHAVAYAGDPNIYVNCSRAGTVQTFNRCEYGYGYIEQTEQCEPHYCIREGNIPANTSTQYYTCSRIFKRLIRSEIKNCVGNGFTFNETLGICTPPIVDVEARAPSQIVETLYHEVPDVTDLVRNAQDVDPEEITPRRTVLDMPRNPEYQHSSNANPDFNAFGIPPMSIFSHQTGYRPTPPFPNMPYLM